MRDAESLPAEKEKAIFYMQKRFEIYVIVLPVRGNSAADGSKTEVKED